MVLPTLSLLPSVAVSATAPPGRLNTMTLLKSPSTGLVQLRFTCELPAVAVAPVTLPGERLSMVTVVPALSLPAVLLLLGLKPLMRAVTAYLAPGCAATVAWVLGVMRILYVVVVVVAVKVLVLSVMVGVLVAGLVTEPYTHPPAPSARCLSPPALSRRPGRPRSPAPPPPRHAPPAARAPAHRPAH